MKSVRFIDIWHNVDTNEFHVDTTVDCLDKEDTLAITGEVTDKVLEKCVEMPVEQVRAMQTMLLSFAAGIAAASGDPQGNIDYFIKLVAARQYRQEHPEEE